MLKVLIVDDNTSYRQSLRDLLCQQFPDMKVAEAGSRDEALEKVKKTVPDFLLIDIELAGESGLELTKKIRADHADTNIAMLTSYDLPEYRQAARECGANFFFSKATSTVEDILEWMASSSPTIVIP